MSGRFLYCQNCGNYLGSLGGDSCHCGWNAGSDPDDDDDDSAVTEAAPAVPAATYKLAGDRMEIWNSPFHDLQTRLEICAGSVAFERSVAANMRRQRDEAKAALASLPAVVQGDGASADEVIQLAQALEQRRAIGITEAVNALAANYVNETFRAGFESACEEITHRLRTEEWELCLPPSGIAGEGADTGKATP